MSQTRNDKVITQREGDYYKCILSPGYVVVATDPTLLCSVCGNGVVVILRDRIKKVGGMVHCIFPKKEWDQNVSNYQADIAIAQLIKKMIESKCSLSHLEAQIYGGGNLRGHNVKRAKKVVSVVKRILKKFNIEIVTEDIGGILGRKVMFDTQTGDVLILKTKNVRKHDWAPEYLIKK